MGSSFAFPGRQGTRPATSWENKCCCQSLLWVPRLLLQTGTWILPAFGSGVVLDLLHEFRVCVRGVRWQRFTSHWARKYLPCWVIFFFPGSWIFSATGYFPSQFIGAILRKFLGRGGHYEIRKLVRGQVSACCLWGTCTGPRSKSLPLAPWSAASPGPFPSLPSALAILFFLS